MIENNLFLQLDDVDFSKESEYSDSEGESLIEAIAEYLFALEDKITIEKLLDTLFQFYNNQKSSDTKKQVLLTLTKNLDILKVSDTAEYIISRIFEIVKKYDDSTDLPEMLGNMCYNIWKTDLEENIRIRLSEKISLQIINDFSAKIATKALFCEYYNLIKGLFFCTDDSYIFKQLSLLYDYVISIPKLKILAKTLNEFIDSIFEDENRGSVVEKTRPIIENILDILSDKIDSEELLGDAIGDIGKNIAEYPHKISWLKEIFEKLLLIVKNKISDESVLAQVLTSSYGLSGALVKLESNDWAISMLKDIRNILEAFEDEFERSMAISDYMKTMSELKNSELFLDNYNDLLEKIPLLDDQEEFFGTFEGLGKSIKNLSEMNLKT